MSTIKKRYWILVLALITFATLFVYLIIASPLGAHSRLSETIQTLGIFAALLAAAIALAAADPKKKSVKVNITLSVNERNMGTYQWDELSDDLKKYYEDFPRPLRSHRVQFNVVNDSGYTLEKPTLTFRLPIRKQHPYKEREPTQLCKKRSFNSNLFNSQEELRLLEFADTLILSNTNLPYWNDQDEITIWIRMILDDGKLDPFNVDVSVNSANADGITKKVKIDPKRLVR